MSLWTPRAAHNHLARLYPKGDRTVDPTKNQEPYDEYRIVIPLQSRNPNALSERRKLDLNDGGSTITKGGPTTEEGKEVVRWNDTRHGVRSPAPVVPGVENQKDWETHLSGVLESLAPEGHLETVLAERVGRCKKVVSVSYIFAQAI